MKKTFICLGLLLLASCSRQNVADGEGYRGDRGYNNEYNNRGYNNRGYYSDDNQRNGYYNNNDDYNRDDRGNRRWWHW